MSAKVEHHPEILIQGNPKFSSVTQHISQIVEDKTKMGWILLFGLSASILMMLLGAVGYLLFEGIGVWGNNQPVSWAFDIVNFVFWVGIGHAGTLISAILFLFRQKWRTSINRFAEAMTIFAVICALMFPSIHVGRAWLLYWVMPLPNQMAMWPNFRSPLLWDMFAVGTYFTCSLLFWYVGLIPDLATLRDRATTKIRKIAYGIFALGWHGGNTQWKHYELAYLILAGISTPLVLSVHSIVVDRLCDVGASGLAYDNLPAIFRGRRNFLRVCNGDDAGADCPQDLQAGKLHYYESSREDEQDHAGDRHDGRLLLWL